MKDLALAEQEQISDCDFLIGKLEHTMDDLENCFEAVSDEKRTKMNVVGSIFRFGVSLTKLTLNATGCAIKNTPKALVKVAVVKKELANGIDTLVNESVEIFNDEMNQFQKDALDYKIKQLAKKKITL